MKEKCPKCNAELEEVLSWIEHNGFGHPGPMITKCSKCDYVKPYTCEIITNAVKFTILQEKKDE